MLQKIVQMFGKDDKNLISLRFVLMCLLGYFGFLRYSELANLRRSDIRIFQDRLDLFIKQSKTDKFKEGAWIVISATGNTVCPKTHLLAYMKLANINENSNNYIFRSVVKTKSNYKLHKSRKLSYTRAREILLGNLEKLVCLRAVSDCIASDQAGLQQQGTQEFLRD